MNALKTAIVDLKEGFKRFGLSATLAWEDLKDRYRRSVLGLLWIIIAFLTFVLVMLLIFGRIFDAEGFDYTTHLVVGFAVFGFISSLIPGSGDVFAVNKAWILSTNLPYSVYANALVLKSFFELAIVGATAALLVIFLGNPNPGHLWTIIPALALYYLTALGLCFAIGPIGTRYRDFVYLLQSVTRMLFFATPVFWVATPDTSRGLISMYNPATYFLDIIRLPINEGRVSMTAWMICGLCCLGLWVIGFISFSVSKRKIALWL